MLEGILWTPPAHAQTRVARGAIVCHPHPQYGGSMHNKVVFRAGRALHQLGMVVLRFNFRGVGRSTGSYDYGHGERADVQAAIDYLNQQYPQIEIVLAGFSFGAWVGLAVGAQHGRVSHLIGIGMPVNMNDFSFLVNCTKPKLFIQGSEDEFGSIECMQALLLTIPEPKELVWVEGADHFFHRKLEPLADAITDYFTR
ncbi:MAG: alpha/beta fold hydrolase [Acidobacteriota bacterium]|nr:alpha/beta fold hydrolase [Blastocatellia bacterium]MDW8241191.1 alpha/beta fold hydrolase [Acidobacteriota bacterium]